MRSEDGGQRSEKAWTMDSRRWTKIVSVYGRTEDGSEVRATIYEIRMKTRNLEMTGGHPACLADA